MYVWSDLNKNLQTSVIQLVYSILQKYYNRRQRTKLNQDKIVKECSKIFSTFLCKFYFNKYYICRIFNIYILKYSLRRSISNHCFWQWKVLLVNYCKTDQSPYCRKLRELLSTFHWKNWRNQIENWNLIIFRCWEQDTTVWSSEIFF